MAGLESGCLFCFGVSMDIIVAGFPQFEEPLKGYFDYCGFPHICFSYGSRWGFKYVPCVVVHSVEKWPINKCFQPIAFWLSIALVYLLGYLDGSTDAVSNHSEIVLHKLSLISADVPNLSICVWSNRMYFCRNFNLEGCPQMIMCSVVSSLGQRGHELWPCWPHR